MGRVNKRWQRRRGTVAWWFRLFAASIFALYLNYLPIHLLTEPHSHDAALAMEATHSEGHHDAKHDGHDEHHVPHPSSEHVLDVLPKVASLFVCLAFLTPDPIVAFEVPEFFSEIVSVERTWLPGESPPDPLQPRAPPVA